MGHPAPLCLMTGRSGGTRQLRPIAAPPAITAPDPDMKNVALTASKIQGMRETIERVDKSRMVPCGGGHYQFVVLGYVFMPEHVHLLISEPEKGNPSVVIQALKLGFVRQLFPTSRKKQWDNPKLFQNRPPRQFWQKRFYDFNLWSARKRIEKLRYIHRNPVKRGLLDTPDQWKWRSF